MQQRSDEALVAYLDGELAADEGAAIEIRLSAEPAFKARLDELDRGGRAFGHCRDGHDNDGRARQLVTVGRRRPTVTTCWARSSSSWPSCQWPKSRAPRAS